MEYRFYPLFILFGIFSLRRKNRYLLRLMPSELLSLTGGYFGVYLVNILLWQ